MKDLTGILLVVAVPCVYAGFMLRGSWDKARTRKRFASLVFTIAVIAFACFVIGDLLGPREILHILE